MVLFILTETSAGYALLKAKDKKLLKRDDLATETKTAEGTAGLLKLKEFKKFENAASALEEAAALTDGKVCTWKDCWVHRSLYSLAIGKDLNLRGASKILSAPAN